MGFQDHEYANTTHNRVMPTGFTYKSKYKQEMSWISLACDSVSWGTQHLGSMMKVSAKDVNDVDRHF